MCSSAVSPHEPQPTRVYGHDQDYPGSYRWPKHEVLCPECGRWVREYGEVSTTIGEHEHWLCIECGNRVWVAPAGGETASDRDQN